MQRLIRLACGVLIASMCSVATAEVGDVLLSTDHPQYPGEGAFQTPQDCVRWATKNATTNHQRSLAIFNYMLTHQWHLHSPQEWCQAGRQPGASKTDYEMVVYDANRARFSYGYGLCGTVHAWNEPYWAAAGYQARRRAFPGHTNSEVFVDGKWRMFDTDMAAVVLDRDDSVAGYDEITKDLALLEREQDDLPRYPFAWPADFEGMKAGWQQIAQGGNWYKLYHGGYAAQPGIVHLRSGETLTRYAHPDGFGGKDKRRFWHQQENGPSRLWTFANGGKPFHRGDQSNSRGRASYGNAVFEFQPDLTSPSCWEGVVAKSDNVTVTQDGLGSNDGQPAMVTFEHFSPYVICGDPVDDKDPMQNKATDGFIVEGNLDRLGWLETSGDQGQTWQVLGTVEGDFRFDVTEQMKGRYGWQVRLNIAHGSTLGRLRFSTTCQLCQSIYPRLKEHGATVTYRSDPRAVTAVLPRLESEDATVQYCEVKKLRSSNLDFVGRTAEQRLAYRVRGPQPAHVVFQVDGPSKLVGLSAAGRFAVRSPTPRGAEYRLDYSIDEGQTWQELGIATPPHDNEFSSGWVYGTKEFDQPAGRKALIKVTLNGGGYGTGLLTVELYGLHQTTAPSAATVTYSWFEGGQRKESSFQTAAGEHKQVAKVPTGGDVTDDFVRISVKP